MNLQWICKPTLVLLIASVMTGCATPLQRETRDRVNTTERTAVDRIAEARAQDEGYYREVDALYVGSDVIDLAMDAERQPAVLDRPVTFNRTDAQTLGQIAEFVSRGYGVSVVVAQDALEHTIKQQTASAQPVMSSMGDTAAQTPLPQALPGSFKLRYSGTLRGLLDAATSMTGNSWRMRGSSIEIYHLDTRVFAISAFASTKKVTRTITNSTGASAESASGSGSSGGTEAKSAQTTDVTTGIDAFQAIETTIKAMVSSEGRVASTGTTGAVTVTDVPLVLDRVAQYVKLLNERMVRQVAVDVVLYSVETTKGENYALNWDLVYKYMNDQTQLDLVSFGAAPIDSNSLSATIVDSNSRFNGSKLIFDALSSQGDAAVVSQAPLMTLSGHPVPFQATSSDSYLREVEINQVANVGATTTLTPGTVVTGLAMNVMPLLLDDQSILIEAQIQLSTLNGFRSVGSNDPTQPRIEVPSIDSRDIMQTVRLRSGQTLLLSGFEQDRLISNSRGVGSADFFGAGGGKNTTKRRTLLVLAITAKAVR
jgi:type IVB pilus formation R64 PilN family outer membrane protein